MNQKGVETAPSETALFVALRRAIAQKEYHNARFGPDYLAEIFLPPYFRFFLRFEKIRENTKHKLANAMPGMNEYIIARTAFFDGQFTNALKSQIPQIVLLGAGYDSRACRFAKLNNSTQIFELDALPTQNRKIKCLKAANLKIPKEVHFVPINFVNESLSEVLEKAGYKRQDQTLFLWEGVSYYLGQEAVSETLAFISRCSHPDSVIAFDYTVSLSEENMSSYYGASQFMQSMQEHHAQEGLLFSIKDDEIEAFLAASHLHLIDQMDNKTMEEKFLTDENGSLIGRMAGIFRIACASPMRTA